MPELPTRKRILRKFRIDEISSVDRPAQAGARAVLLKRAPDPTAKQRTGPHGDERDEAHGWLVAEGRKLRASGGVDVDEIDRQLMEMAHEMRKAGESDEQSFARLASGAVYHPEFKALLAKRMDASP